MPRKNRQKLHRELRLRAEARKAEAVAERRRRQQEADRVARAAAEVLAGRRVAPSARPRTSDPDRLFQECRILVELAPLVGAERRALRELCQGVEAAAPGRGTISDFPWLVLLSRRRWVRRLRDLEVSADAPLCQTVAAHLLCAWPVPAFLLRGLTLPNAWVARVPVEDEWIYALVAHIGAGRSLRDAAGTYALPAPLTRGMQRAFMEQAGHLRPIEALRRA
ncbi:MAG TPA: hypothetical protein PKA64_17505, partial [Myxococcota bacterium]|nr:hypothetical protein [Myxococcota bacterium]